MIPSCAAPLQGRSFKWPAGPVRKSLFCLRSPAGDEHPTSRHRHAFVFGVDCIFAQRRRSGKAHRSRSADLPVLGGIPPNAWWKKNPSLSEFDCSIFNGRYVTGQTSLELSRKLEKGAKGRKPVALASLIKEDRPRWTQAHRGIRSGDPAASRCRVRPPQWRRTSFQCGSS